MLQSVYELSRSIGRTVLSGYKATEDINRTLLNQHPCRATIREDIKLEVTTMLNDVKGILCDVKYIT